MCTMVELNLFLRYSNYSIIEHVIGANLVFHNWLIQKVFMKFNLIDTQTKNLTSWISWDLLLWILFVIEGNCFDQKPDIKISSFNIVTSHNNL